MAKLFFFLRFTIPRTNVIKIFETKLQVGGKFSINYIFKDQESWVGTSGDKLTKLDVNLIGHNWAMVGSAQRLDSPESQLIDFLLLLSASLERVWQIPLNFKRHMRAHLILNHRISNDKWRLTHKPVSLQLLLFASVWVEVFLLLFS